MTDEAQEKRVAPHGPMVFGNGLEQIIRSVYDNGDVAGCLKILPTHSCQLALGVCQRHINIEGNDQEGFRFVAVNHHGKKILEWENVEEGEGNEVDFDATLPEVRGFNDYSLEGEELNALVRDAKLNKFDLYFMSDISSTGAEVGAVVAGIEYVFDADEGWIILPGEGYGNAAVLTGHASAYENARQFVMEKRRGPPSPHRVTRPLALKMIFDLSKDDSTAQKRRWAREWLADCGYEE